MNYGSLSALCRLFTNEMSAPSCPPAAGSAVALCGALAASLGEMVCGLSTPRRVGEDHAARLTMIRESLSVAKERLLELVDEDADAVEKLIHSGDKNPEITARGTMVPLSILQAVLDIGGELRTVAEIGNVLARADARVGVILAEATAKCAAVIIQANIKDPDLEPSIKEQARNELSRIYSHFDAWPAPAI